MSNKYRIVENGVIRQQLEAKGGYIAIGHMAISAKNIFRYPGRNNIYPEESPVYNEATQELSAPYFDEDAKCVRYHIFDVSQLNELNWKVRDRNGLELERKIRVRILIDDAKVGEIWNTKAIDLLIQESPSFRVNTNGEKDPNGTLKEIYLMYISDADKAEIEQYVAAKAEYGAKLDYYEGQ
jgi:hypothetical protein